MKKMGIILGLTLIIGFGCEQEKAVEIGVLSKDQTAAMGHVYRVKGDHNTMDGSTDPGSSCQDYDYAVPFTSPVTSAISCTQFTTVSGFNNDVLKNFFTQSITKSKRTDTNKYMAYYTGANQTMSMVDAEYYNQTYYDNLDISNNGGVFYMNETPGTSFHMVLYTWEGSSGTTVNVSTLTKPSISTNGVSTIQLGSSSAPCGLASSQYAPCEIKVTIVDGTTSHQYHASMARSNKTKADELVETLPLMTIENKHVGFLKINGPKGFVFSLVDLAGRRFQ